jgi:hypothetical protein
MEIENLDSAELEAQANDLRKQIKEAFDAGNIADVSRLQSHLKEMPMLVLAVEIKELRDKISDISTRLGEIIPESAELEKIRKERNDQLAVAIEQHQRAELARNKVDLALYLLDAEGESLREARREYRVKLEKLLADAEAQIGEIQI